MSLRLQQLHKEKKNTNNTNNIRNENEPANIPNKQTQKALLSKFMSPTDKIMSPTTNLLMKRKRDKKKLPIRNLQDQLESELNEESTKKK
ncbi:hydroxyproline-rich glycoprotein family protein [Anaeramoeba ignava]|uniref:Hydroxyproline-rich glycoprotein family protein n=1 Tax=Anaeramoeba ignava TaxID=1746090 RepID=A0A9Q0LA57_ANAIG|nr:hydroxyproline-rich glycoprotein family protein [Anaeramoeba ignava]